MQYLELPTVVAVGAALIVPALTLMAAFFVVHRIWLNNSSDDDKNAAGWGSFRIGAIHALIVSLQFSATSAEYGDLMREVDEEALALEQLYRGLDVVDGAEALQRQIAVYVRFLIDKEWPSLAQGQPLADADVMIDEIRVSLHRLLQGNPNINVQETLLSHVDIADTSRGSRIFDVSLHEPADTLFWYAVALTFFSTTVCFFVYRPTRITYMIIGMFAAINGLLFLAMIDFNKPFQGIATVTPTVLELVYDRTMN